MIRHVNKGLLGYNAAEIKLEILKISGEKSMAVVKMPKYQKNG